MAPDRGVAAKILFVAGFGPISADAAAGRRFYSQALGIEFKEEEGGYLHTEDLQGVKTFAAWPLSQAAESCFGSPNWPSDLPVPQAWLEFDVEDIDSATSELQERGFVLLVSKRTEPWGQTVTRLIGPEGLLIGLTVTPWMRG